MLSRREFLAGTATVPFALRAMAVASATAPQRVLLGTDLGKGIYRARWDAATGSLRDAELAIATERPNFFAMHPKLPGLYSVNSVGGGKGGVSSFRVDAATGGLKLMNRVSSHGDGPCAVSVGLPWAFVANYTGGSFAAYGVSDDGALVDDRGGFRCAESAVCGVGGPVKNRQDAAHLHSVTIAPNGDAVVCDLGDDSLLVFAGPKEQTQPPLRYPARTGSGPRHVAFHPNKRWMYCMHELDCTIDLYDWSVRGWKGALKLREGSVISTLAKGTSLKGNTGCEVVVSHDGKFVYACTRGVDEITVYRADATTGLLTEQQRLSCGGKVPRYFAFDPSGRWLVCTNQGTGVSGSGSVTVFAHDAATGRLSETPKTFAAVTPMFVLWV